MNLTKATSKYEDWLSQHLRLLPRDLEFKHAQMRSAPFAFLRATYYRWAQVWSRVCPDLVEAPVALAVGDLLEAESGALTICKYVGFESASWLLPEVKSAPAAGDEQPENTAQV